MSHQPRKRFGQNFLRDEGVIQRIVESINPGRDDHVVEIGPGEAAITAKLAKLCGRLDAIELDRDLAPMVSQRCGNPENLHVHNADALRFDFCTLDEGKGLRIVGNLPYNISTPLLFHLLDQAQCVKDMHVMLQKEVVERLASPPGNKSYGRLSIAIQARCEVIPLFEIGPESFFPPPKIDSAVVRLIPKSDSIAAIRHPEMLNTVLIQAFGKRRKTLRNALKELASAQTLEANGINPSARAETIAVADFVALSNNLGDQEKSIPDE